MAVLDGALVSLQIRTQDSTPENNAGRTFGFSAFVVATGCAIAGADVAGIAKKKIIVSISSLLKRQRSAAKDREEKHSRVDICEPILTAGDNDWIE